MMTPTVRMIPVATRHGPGWRVVVEAGEWAVGEWVFLRRREARRLVAALRAMGCHVDEAWPGGARCGKKSK